MSISKPQLEQPASSGAASSPAQARGVPPPPPPSNDNASAQQQSAPASQKPRASPPQPPPVPAHKPPARPERSAPSQPEHAAAVAPSRVDDTRVDPGTITEARALIALCEAELESDPGPTRTVQLQMQLGWAHEHMLNDVHGAAYWYEQSLLMSPEHVPAITATRRAYLAGARISEALPLFDVEMRFAPRATDKAALAYEKGWWLEQLEEQAQAGEAYRAALELEPRHAAALKALERLASTNESLVELTQVYAQLGSALSEPAHRAALLVQRASLIEAHAQGLERAAELYEAALKLDPGAVGALPALTRIYHATARYSELVGVLERRAEQAEDLATRAAFLCDLARVSVARFGNLPEALAALEQARQAVPNDPLVLEDLARLHERAHRYAPLAEVLGQLAELAPDAQTRVAVLHRLGRLYEHELDRAQEAVAAYGAALRIVPAHEPSLHAVERLLRNQGDFRELVRVWSTVADAATSDAQRLRAHLSIAAVADSHLKDASLALDHYERALLLAPENATAFLALTRLCSQAGKHRELIALYERAINRTTDLAHRVSYLFRVAAIYEQTLSDPAQAAATYRRVLKLVPDHLGAIQALAIAAEAAGLYPEVVGALELELGQTSDPHHKLALLNRLGSLLADQLADPEGAALHFRRALELDAHDATALSGLAQIQHASGRWEDLLGTYRIQIESMPSGLARADLLFKMGELAETQLGQSDVALTHYQAALTDSPGHDPSLRALGRVLTDRGAFQQLATILTAQAEFVRVPRNKAHVHYRVGQVYEDQLADAAAALVAYRASLAACASYRPAREAVLRLADSQGESESLLPLLQEESANQGGDGAAALLRKAQVYRDKVRDARRATGTFEALLGAAQGQLPALLALEPLHTAAGHRDALANLYALEASQFQDTEARLSALKELLRIQMAQAPHDAAARTTLDQLLALSPGDSFALSLLEHFAAKHADAELRARLDERCTERTSDARVAADRQASLGFHFEQQGRPREAFARYKAALAQHAEHLPSMLGLGRTAQVLGDAAAVAEAKSRQAAFTVRSAHAADLLVEEAYVRLRSLNEAEASSDLLQRALVLSPEHEQAALKLAEQLLARGELERLVKALENAAHAARVPGRVSALWMCLGDLQRQQLGNVPAAITALERADAAQPHNAGTLARLAELYIENRQWSDAVRTLDEVATLSLDEREVLAARLKLIDVWSNHLHDAHKASTFLDAVLLARPDHPEALGLLVDMQCKAGELELALQTAQRLVLASQGPARAAALMRVANIERERGNESSYFQTLCQAVRLAGARTEAASELQNFANTPSLAKAYADALDGFLQASGPDAADVPSYLELARVQAEMLQWGQQAIETLARGLERTRGASAIAAALTKRLELAGRHDEALKFVQAALLKDVTSAELWRELASNLEKAKRKTEGRLALAALDVLGCATEAERKAAEAGRAQLAPPSPGSFARPTLNALGEGALVSPAMRVLEALIDPIAKLHPVDLTALGLGKQERIGGRSLDTLKPLIDSAAMRFGVSELEVYVSEARPALAQVFPTVPPTLVLSREIERLTENEQSFIVSRAMAAIAGRFHPVLALPVEELARLFAAAGHTVQPGFGQNMASPQAIEEQAQQLRKAFSWLASRKPLDEAATAFVQAPLTDLADWVRTLEQTAARAAAAAVGDLPAAVRVLMRDAGADPRDPSAFVRAHPTGRALLQFWGSGGAAQALRHTGMLD